MFDRILLQVKGIQTISNENANPNANAFVKIFINKDAIFNFNIYDEVMYFDSKR